MTNWEDEAFDVVNAALEAEYGGYQEPTARYVVLMLSSYGLLREDD